jgi:hypothetical protein
MVPAGGVFLAICAASPRRSSARMQPPSRQARVLKVEGGRRLRSSLAPASVNDFRTSDAGTCDSARVLRPGVSLYCLDHPNRAAIFVEADEERLADAAFLYQAQARHARALICVPYEELHELADFVSLDSTRVALIYSTGRCGSTLVSRALTQAPLVTSLSEPDVFTNLVSLRAEGRVSDEELRELVRSCLLLQLAPHVCRASPRLIAVKLRSFVVYLADVLSEVFRDAKVVFMYRDAEGYFRSAARMVGLHRWEQLSAPAPRMLAAMRPLVPLLDEHASARSQPPSTADVIVCMWASAMRDAERLFGSGMPVFCMRYEDMQADAKAEIDSLFSFLDIAIDDRSGLDAILRKDSQAGTPLDRSRLGMRAERLSDAVMEKMLSSLAAVAPRLPPALRLPAR